MYKNYCEKKNKEKMNNFTVTTVFFRSLLLQFCDNVFA